MTEVREYLNREGRNLYRGWFDRLNARAAAKVATAVTRLALGNFSNVKGVGSGVFELRIDFGPGYRVYFGKDGEWLIILLGGGIKKRQQLANSRCSTSRGLGACAPRRHSGAGGFWLFRGLAFCRELASANPQETL